MPKRMAENTALQPSNLNDALLGNMSTAKQDVQLLLSKLPDNCSLEDIQYHLYILDKVRRGIEGARIKRNPVQRGS